VTDRRTRFRRWYSIAFCAALWVVTACGVVGAAASDGDQRGRFAFVIVLAGAAALGSTAQLVAVERRMRALERDRG